MSARITSAHALFRRALSFLPTAGLAALVLWREPTGYVLFLFAAVLLHETGHIAAFLLLGEPLPSLRARSFGLLLTPRSSMLSYGRELLVAAAGPLFNLLGALSLLPALWRGDAQDANFCFFALNLLYALFNLLPIAGFDGGRVVFCLLSLCLRGELAQRIHDTLSLACLLLFYFTALFLFFFSDGGSYALLLAFFLLIGEGRRLGILGGDFGRLSAQKRAFREERESTGLNGG